MSNIRKILNNGKRVELPIWNGKTPYALYYNGECVWKNDIPKECSLLLVFAGGLDYISIQPIEIAENKGKLLLKQGDTLNLEVIGSFDYDSSQKFYYSPLEKTKRKTAEIFLSEISQIKDECFKNNTMITQFVANSSLQLKKIGNYAFGMSTTMVDSRLGLVSLPDSVEEFGDYCFRMTKFRTLKFPLNLKKIGIGCFYESKLGGEIVLPSVEIIKPYAFHGCENIISIKIGSNIQEIGITSFYGSPFYNCTNLSKISVEDNEYYRTENNVLFNKSCSELIYYATNLSNETYTIPDTVNKICSGSFANNTKITEINIPESVEYISDNAFGWCSSLQTIDLPDSVLTIESGIFKMCTSLSYIKLPSNLTKIPASICEGCISLENIKFPNITVIGGAAFRATGLIEVVIPKSVTKIGNYAFANCTNLKTIKYMGTEEEWQNVEKMMYWNQNTNAEIIFS